MKRARYFCRSRTEIKDHTRNKRGVAWSCPDTALLCDLRIKTPEANNSQISATSPHIKNLLKIDYL